jgi:hypothetical protein
MSSNSGEEYDPDPDKATEDQDDEEEEVLDESSASELEQPKAAAAKKPKKKPGRGQLRMAVRSAQGKRLPDLDDRNAKRKASDRGEEL